MGKHYEPSYKLMIVGLLQSGQSVKQVSTDYSLDQSMIRRWRREYESNSEFGSKVVRTPEYLRIKELEKKL